MRVLFTSENARSSMLEKVLRESGIDCLRESDLASLPSNNQNIDFIIDLNNAAAAEMPARYAAYSNIGAILICSALCCTATDAMGRLQNSIEVVGINGLSEFWFNDGKAEIAPALQCSAVALSKVEALFKQAAIQTEIVEDRVALVSPRILAALINEAAFAVMEGVASPKDIDIAMKLGVKYPKGLLEWADEIGIDIIVNILDALYSEYHQERYRACILLRQYVRAGFTGKAASRGFFVYGG